MIITQEALKAVVMIGSSCRTPSVKKEGNLQYLYRCVLSGNNFDLVELESRLPQKTSMYSGINAYAFSLGANEIDERIVYRFFGSRVHVDFVLDQISVMGMGGDFSDKFLFAHMLVPVTIISVTADNITAIYENGDIKVYISNLILHPSLSKEIVSEGQSILVHYAVVVGVPPNETKECLLKEQALSREFMDACKRIKRIDYQEFWGLKQWTQELMARCFC